MARILAVDDQPHMTYVIANWLGKLGHQVVRARDGADALALLRARRFDLLITDVDMPGMDGLCLLRQPEVVDRLRGVIVLTGRCDYKDLQRSRCDGRVRLLPKPFSPSTLTHLVEELLRGAPARRDLVASR